MLRFTGDFVWVVLNSKSSKDLLKASAGMTASGLIRSCPKIAAGYNKWNLPSGASSCAFCVGPTFRVRDNIYLIDLARRTIGLLCPRRTLGIL